MLKKKKIVLWESSFEDVFDKLCGQFKRFLPFALEL